MFELLLEKIGTFEDENHIHRWLHGVVKGKCLNEKRGLKRLSTLYADRLVISQSMNVLRGYVYTGGDRQSGLYGFADLNHDWKLTVADQKVVSKLDVTGFGGFKNTIRWKQFQCQVLVDARVSTGINYMAEFFLTTRPARSTQD